jgi:hypothetical protein
MLEEDTHRCTLWSNASSACFLFAGQELHLRSEVGVMNAEERFYAEILSGNLSFVLALLGVAILYANAYLFQDYLGEVVTAYVLAQALKKGREVVLYLLTRLDKDGHAKEVSTVGLSSCTPALF